MLTPPEVAELDTQIAARADLMITAKQTSSEAGPKATPGATRRGRKPKVILNPFYGHLGPHTSYDRYAGFSRDIVEGIARLDWHDRPTTTNEALIGKSGIVLGKKSMPLSVEKIHMILETLSEVTTQGVRGLLGYGQSHAQRYVKALELAIPFMMKERPPTLIDAMGHRDDWVR